KSYSFYGNAVTQVEFVLFESDPDRFRMLVMNLKVNGFDEGDPRIRLVHGSLGVEQNADEG
ncbi:unnamed protein product, partial [Amoebophrya sp. A25]